MNARTTVPEHEYGLKRRTREDVLRLACHECGIALRDARGVRQHKEIVHARQLYMYLARGLVYEDGTSWFSLPQIGRTISRDHTTVMHGIRKVEKLLKTDAALREVITRLQHILNAEGRLSLHIPFEHIVLAVSAVYGITAETLLRSPKVPRAHWTLACVYLALGSGMSTTDLAGQTKWKPEEINMAWRDLPAILSTPEFRRALERIEECCRTYKVAGL